MRSMRLKNPSRRIGAPTTWDHEKDGLCHTLEVWDVTDKPDGHNRMVTAWQPSPEELKRLNEGQPVFLHIFGTVHPVVSLEVGVNVEMGPVE